MNEGKVELMSKIMRMAFKQETLRQMYVWNRNRLVKEHGKDKGEQMMRHLPLMEAVRLWQTEGPGKLEIN